MQQDESLTKAKYYRMQAQYEADLYSLKREVKRHEDGFEDERVLTGVAEKLLSKSGGFASQQWDLSDEVLLDIEFRGEGGTRDARILLLPTVKSLAPTLDAYDRKTPRGGR